MITLVGEQINGRASTATETDMTKNQCFRVGLVAGLITSKGIDADTSSCVALSIVKNNALSFDDVWMLLCENHDISSSDDSIAAKLFTGLADEIVDVLTKFHTIKVGQINGD